MENQAPVVQIDLSSPVAVYGQILAALRTVLVSGAMKPGDQLPTVRALAIDLGVNHNTVAEAYRLLALEGWLDLRQGRGATVLDRHTPAPKPEDASRFAKRLEELVAEAIAAGVTGATLAAGEFRQARLGRGFRRRHPGEWPR